MKKGILTVEQLFHILEDESLCRQLLDRHDDCSFLNGQISKKECLQEFERLLEHAVFIMKKEHNFHYMKLIMKVLNRLYLPRIKEDPFLFYENNACIGLLDLLKEFPEQCNSFQKFLDAIHFDSHQKEVEAFYRERISKGHILNDFELKDFLDYLMIYKNHLISHAYLVAVFSILFQKSHDYRLKPIQYAELFRFLILDLLQQLSWTETVHIISLKKKQPFFFHGTHIYINLDVIGSTLEENLSYLSYLFDLFEKRYKCKSFVHNKYEEIKKKKETTIKGIIGTDFFFQTYSYLSIESEIVSQSLIDRLRFFEEIAPDFYYKLIEDYEAQIVEAINLEKKDNTFSHLILSMDTLMNQTVLLVPEVISNQPYLQLEYHLNGKRKKIVELLAQYETELELAFSTKNRNHILMITYYEKTILTYQFSLSYLIDEFISILEYEVNFPRTERLIEKIFCEHFVSIINENIRNHVLGRKDLSILLSKLNEYMLKFYEAKQKQISSYIIKDQKKWLRLNDHLTHLYAYVQYMSNSNLYENAYLNLTQVLDFNYAKEIQRNILKKKIRNQKIYVAILIIFILIFSVSLFLLGKVFWQYWSAYDSYGKIQEKHNQTKPVPILIPDSDRTEFPMNDDIPQLDFEPLKKENEEVVAWIRIDGTEINYPVVQGKDNEFYLSHLYNKKYNISGSIFGDYRNDSNFASDNLVLYGHNLRNGSMFGSLKKYQDLSYLENHKYIWLITPKASYQYEVFATYEFHALKDHYAFNFQNENSYEKYLEDIQKKAISKSNLEVSAKDHILTLSTCSENGSSKRLIVVAKRMVTYVALDNNVSS